VLVVGAGAVGGFFGAQLARAGRDVTFLVRPARAAQIEADGLTVRTPTERFTVRPGVATARALESSGGARPDVVLLAVKSFGLEQAIADVAPAVGPETLVIPLLNGMRQLELLDAAFGAERVLGGYAFISATLEGAEVVQLFGEARVAFGRRDGDVDERMRELERVLGGAGFEGRLSTRILDEMWEKWTMLASGGALTCLLRGDVGQIVAAQGADVGRALVAEVAAVAAASGHPPRASVVESSVARLQEPGSPFTTSMYRDLQQGLDVESEHILGDLVVRAESLGVEVPLTRLAAIALRVYRGAR
jgi:2-dehydropantoate 2-reductase